MRVRAWCGACAEPCVPVWWAAWVAWARLEVERGSVGECKWGARGECQWGACGVVAADTGAESLVGHARGEGEEQRRAREPHVAREALLLVEGLVKALCSKSRTQTRYSGQV
jgi:hypothetical protein